VKQTITVVQTAILEATRFGGKFKVNWDFVDSPNIMYPMIAEPANRTVDRAMLTRNINQSIKIINN
jgi:hypothetical protein